MRILAEMGYTLKAHGKLGVELFDGDGADSGRRCLLWMLIVDKTGKFWAKCCKNLDNIYIYLNVRKFAKNAEFLHIFLHIKGEN